MAGRTWQRAFRMGGPIHLLRDDARRSICGNFYTCETLFDRPLSLPGVLLACNGLRTNCKKCRQAYESRMKPWSDFRQAVSVIEMFDGPSPELKALAARVRAKTRERASRHY